MDWIVPSSPDDLCFPVRWAFWRSAVGVFEIRGPIAARHLELMQQGLRAFPVGNHTPIATNPAGASASFEGGNSIYWSLLTGARWLKGLLASGYAARGGPTSWLGYPVAEEVAATGGWVYDRFQNGSLWYKPGVGVCEQGVPCTCFVPLLGFSDVSRVSDHQLWGYFSDI
jgi:hypothetical protein